MSYRLAAGYLASPASGGVVSFELWWDGASSFSLHATSGGLLTYSQLSRVDFFDRDGTTPLVVIPCAADNSNVSFDRNGSCVFALHLRNLLGGVEAPATFVVRPVQIDQALTPTYDLCFDAQAAGPNLVAGIRLGGEAVFAPDQSQDENNLMKRYIGNLQALRQVGDHPQFKVQHAAGSSFETISGQPFGSEHVTFSVRPIPSGKAGAPPIPVLALRRGYTATSNAVVVSANRAVATLFPEPFDLPIFTAGTDSVYHVVQFPSVDWLNQTLGAAPLPEPPVWHFETGEFPPDQIQQFWQARVLGPYVGGLRIIDAPLPVSTVPSLSWDAVQNYDASWRIVRTAALAADSTTLTLLSERLLPGGYLTAENGDATKALPVACTLPAFRGHDGAALRFNALLEPWTNFDMESERETKQGWAVLHSMQLQLMLTAPIDAQAVRLGSLDLTFGGGFPEDLDTGTFPLPSVRIDFERSELDGRWIPRVYVTGSLPVTRYGPGGEDEPVRDSQFRITPAPGSQETAPAYARSNPIVIDAQVVRSVQAAAAGTPLPPNATAFALTFNELTLPSPQPQQQQLVLTLSEIGKTATAPPGVLVLDREPFTVAYVTLGDAADSDDTDNTLVGVWCNLYPEGPGWRLRAGAGGFNLYLPPQAVGEAMVKDFTYAGGKTTDYRFSPLLKARLLATYFAQNAVQPGWDLRRILGYTGQPLPGALVDHKNGGISFELLHGMTASVTHPALRLSEMFARLGDFPGPLPALDGAGPIDPQYGYWQVQTYNNAARTWANLYGQLLSRPGVFELWDDQQGPELLLDDGVQYTIRKDALYTNDPPPTLPAGTPQPPPPLKGGIGYAVESPNIERELLGNLASTAGRLVSPRFTALGGYGTQRAEFANGKVIVDSRTTMGRLESMTVTLVGRIGTLYNHALHVTVYERTALPSDQFYLEQDRFAGFPLLRKVSEYVLLTEDTRAYPEDASSDAALAGFVTASHFKSTRINVDGVWGGDVGDIGWQVPLWQEDAVPAGVYPKPHIALKVSVDPAVGVDGVLGEIDDPQKLCFYTDTRGNTTSDTDSWPVIPGIDWIDQPESPDRGAGADFQDPSVEPGFGNFTYHFVESPAQVNIVAARAKTAVGATLKNVSMMRGPRLTAATAPADAAALRQQAARRLTDWWTATNAHLEQSADTAAQAIAAAGNTAAAQAQAAQRLKDSIQSVQDTYLNSGLGKELSALGGVAGAACDAVKARLHSAMDRVNGEQQTVVSAMLQQFPAQVLSRLDAITAATQADFVKAVNDQVGQMTSAAQKTLVPVIGDVGTVQSAIANYKTKLDAYAAAIVQLSKAITNAGGKATAELRTAAIAVEPGSNLRSSLDSAAVAVSQASRYILGNQGTGVVASIDGAIDVALTQLSGALFQTGADISGFVGLVQMAISKLTPIFATAAAACANATNTLGTLQPSKLQTFFSTLGTNLSTAIQAPGLQSIADVRAAYTNFLQGIISDAGNAAGTIQQAISDHEMWIDNQASTLCRTLSLDVTALLGQLSDLAKDELSSFLQNYAGDLDDFQNALQTMGDQVESQLKQVTAAVAEEAQKVVSGAAGAALQVIRAFGEPPHVPNMGFQVPMDVPVLDLPSMAYRFTNALPAVDLTPARAMASQIAQGLSLPNVGGLSQMGVHLPTTQLLDRLVPASLENFDLRDILPKFAGIDLSTLFAGVRMPSVANDTVRVTHHIDPQTKRASLDADIHVPLASDTTILDLGPVTLLLEDAEFTAHVHCQVTVGQQITQTSSGEITGDWQLLIGGMEILGFTQTTLSFDSSGAMHFSITPANVRLSEVLQFLADIVNSFTFGDSGFSIHATVDPLAVQCILELPLPDMSAGAFGIQNLHFGAVFEVGIDANGFYLGVGANLARKTLPFILTVFVLGGAGWMEASLRYQNGKATGEITIGMAASASIAIALGPISGSVSIDFGIFVEFAIGGGGGLQLGIMILIVGRVSLCGIIDANITLLLEAQYSSGGGLVGRGYVSVTIKICWCFTLNVHSSVSFAFGASKQTQPPAHAAIQPPAANAAGALPAVAAAAPVAAAGVASPIAAPVAAPPPPPVDQYKQAALDYVDMLA
jgi:hypothetical protein